MITMLWFFSDIKKQDGGPNFRYAMIDRYWGRHPAFVKLLFLEKEVLFYNKKGREEPCRKKY